jgi:hypothetical protein
LHFRCCGQVIEPAQSSDGRLSHPRAESGRRSRNGWKRNRKRRRQSVHSSTKPSGSVITFEGRSPFLGFDVLETLLLGNSAYSTYHSAQLSLTKRLSKGLQFNAAYTISKSIDNASADPGSTAGGGKPDLPNVGFTAQGSAFDTNANRAVSDFDRPHRFGVSFVYDIPSFGSHEVPHWLESFGLWTSTVRTAVLDLLA